MERIISTGETAQRHPPLSVPIALASRSDGGRANEIEVQEQPCIRKAVASDLPALRGLHRASLQVLAARCYSHEEMGGFLADIVTADPQLIEDGTYYVAEVGGVIAASGGWTMRRPSYEAALASEPCIDRVATIRAIFTGPAFAGHGLARRIMGISESAAVLEGQAEHIELCATLSAIGFYRSLGYVEGNSGVLRLSNGTHFGYRHMSKTIVPSAGQEAA